jgi:hypothetical protein
MMIQISVNSIDSIRFLPLWVGARGVEFDWKYIQMSFDSNIALVKDSMEDKMELMLTILSYFRFNIYRLQHFCGFVHVMI